MLDLWCWIPRYSHTGNPKVTKTTLPVRMSKNDSMSILGNDVRGKPLFWRTLIPRPPFRMHHSR